MINSICCRWKRRYFTNPCLIRWSQRAKLQKIISSRRNGLFISASQLLDRLSPAALVIQYFCHTVHLPAWKFASAFRGSGWRAAFNWAAGNRWNVIGRCLFDTSQLVVYLPYNTGSLEIANSVYVSLDTVTSAFEWRDNRNGSHDAGTRLPLIPDWYQVIGEKTTWPQHLINIYFHWH